MSMENPTQKVSATELINRAETSAAVLGSYLVGRKENHIDLESLQIAAAERFLQLGDEQKAFNFTNLAEQTRLSNESQRIAEMNIAGARLNQRSAQGIFEAAENQKSLVSRNQEIAELINRAANTMSQASLSMQDAARRFPQR